MLYGHKKYVMITYTTDKNKRSAFHVQFGVIKNMKTNDLACKGDVTIRSPFKLWCIMKH